jgi:heme o synthase
MMTTRTLPDSTRSRLADLVALIKVKQTALLVVTGLSAYVLSANARANPLDAGALTLSLFLAVSGCTVLNMLLDRDIDGKMDRTALRPLPAGRIRPGEALFFGGSMTLAGLSLAFGLDPRFGSIVFLGLALDLLVYTLWLKRLTPLSIVFGGIAGGMPALAGRVLALGKIDLIGLLLAGAILLWIPSHILTLAMRHAGDYQRGGVPMWPLVYGPHATRIFIAITTLLNAITLTICGLLLHIAPAAMALQAGMSLAMSILSVRQIVHPIEGQNWLLFKAASIYMLLSMLCLALGVVLGPA